MDAQIIRDYRQNFSRSLLMHLFGIIFSAVFIFGCGSSNNIGGNDSCTIDNAVATESVTVKNNFFDPQCIKVSSGATVTWTNTGSAIHTVTSDNGAPESFDSGALGASGIFSHTFNTAGTVNYHCTPHESLDMKGTAIIE